MDSSTKFSQTSVRLSFNENTQKNYIAGFPFYVELDVEALTVTDIENMPVKLTMISGLTELKYLSKNVLVQNRKVYASFDVPENVCALKITAEMEVRDACDTVFACFQPERLVSKTKEFIRLVKTEPDSYRAGGTASYKLLSSKRVESLLLVILSKGNMVKSWGAVPEWEEDESGKFYTEGSMTIPPDMITRSRLLVLAADNVSGYILASAIDMSIVEDLTHKLSLQMDTRSAKPGDNVTMFLTSDPNSFVGVSVTDVSLELIKKPCKVLTKESTLSFVRELDGITRKDLSCERNDPYQCKSNTKVKTIDIKGLLDSEGLQLTTNMMLHDYDAAEEFRDDDMLMYSEREFSGSSGGGRGNKKAKASNRLEEFDSAPEDEETEKETLKIRNNFPETWLWTDMVSDENGKNVISAIAPDTITGWKGSAFGLSPEKGLGFSNEIEFQTFLPFFISLDLPYSGTVGERITIPVSIFNYLDDEVSATVRISSEMWGAQDATVTIASNKARTIEYEISLTEAGNHDITVTADTKSGESDSVQKILLVQPGGEKIFDTSSVLIMQKDRSVGKTVMTVRLPDGFIPGSHRLKFVAVGDILGEAIAGISSLIQLPSGCGEQNMHKIAINVFSANYIKSLYDELPENLDYSIKHNLNIGLQQQLAYRRGTTGFSHGYSIFKGGPSSDWLTAFVYKIVSLFPEQVFVPCNSALDSDRDYLTRLIELKQGYKSRTAVNRDGWAPYQYNFHQNRDLYWQSYFLISMLESNGVNRCGSTLTDSSYNSDRLGNVCNSILELSARSDDCCYHHMVAYSVQLCKDHGLLDQVSRLSSSDDEKCMGSSTDGRYKFASCEENLEFESFMGSSKSIEATGYAALFFMQKDKIEDSLPMIMWLASQRNENGGFRSSQDTVIGLQALDKFAEVSNADMPKRTDLTILLGKGGSYFEKVRIKEEKKMSTKEIMLAPEFGEYKVKWTGVGTAFVQMVSEFHVSSKYYSPLYMLEAAAATYEGLPTIKVAFRLPEESSSTMHLLEVASPTGMVFTKSFVEGQLQLTDGGFSAITRYDIKEGGQRLHLYVDPATKLREIEFKIPMDTKFEVTNRMPVQVSLIDYYNPSKRQTIFYSFDESDAGVDAMTNIGCSLALSCDLLESTEAIVLGYPGKSTGDVLQIKNAFPYKECKGSTVQNMRVDARFASSPDRLCVPSLRNTKSFFLLRYSADGRMEITGMTSYELALPKIAECFSVIKSCDQAE